MKNIFIAGLCIIYIAATTGCCSVPNSTNIDADTATATTTAADSNSSSSSDNVESKKQKTESEFEKAMTLFDDIMTYVLMTIYHK